MNTEVIYNGSLETDLAQIAQIPIIPRMLDVIAQTTGMGFVGVARVTDSAWLACSVRDTIGFGLKPGEELELETTICNEIRQHHQPVVIDHVDADPHFRNHHTPLRYGFQSYISVPIFRRDGTFFGTLCAIDPSPRHLSAPAITGMFALFADLISFHLAAVEELQHSLSRLERTSAELHAFTNVATHDLQEPLRKIRFYSDKLMTEEGPGLSERGRADLGRISRAAGGMQQLVRALIDYPRPEAYSFNSEHVDLHAVLQEAQDELRDLFEQKGAVLDIGPLPTIPGDSAQFRQLFYQLLHNALRFAQPEVPARISVQARSAQGQDLPHKELAPGLRYCHIRVQDNGIGFPEVYSVKIFDLFQRLHPGIRYEGAGMGLAIVRRIVEEHKGLITASGRVNEGATFDIYIPAG